MTEQSKQSKAAYLVRRSDGDRLRINGCIPSVEPPAKATVYAAARAQCEQLPEWVDLRPYLSPIENQGRVGSCTANALAGAYEYLVRRQSNDTQDVSRLFLYFNARQRDGIQGDRGSSITTSITILQELGICREQLWAYNPAYVDVQPSNEAYQEAQYFQVLQAARVDIDAYSIKHCLAQGYPITFGMRLYKSFDQVNESGWVPMPDPSEASRKEHGMHAMLCVGYTDEYQAFIVRNSWGEHWGHQGYCYIPYDYLANPQFSFDFWTIYTVEDSDLTPGISQPGCKPSFQFASAAPKGEQTPDYDFVFEADDNLVEIGTLLETQPIPTTV